jgi:endonuclease-3
MALSKKSDITVKKGIYILEITLDKDTTINFGKRYTAHFFAGYYYYIGSALNNIDARLIRHLSDNKKIHWHIDFLLKYGRIKNIWIKETNEQEECTVAQKIAKQMESIPNFGSSDCRCHSHLFYSKTKDTLFIKNDGKLSKYPLVTKF